MTCEAATEPILFKDDETGYHQWLVHHHGGFVINAERKPRTTYLILHRSDCYTINDGDHFTDTTYVKYCAPWTLILTRWAREVVGGPPTRCPTCSP